MTLMVELWDDLVADGNLEDSAVTAQIEQRWKEYQEHPERVRPWNEVKARIQASRA